MAASGTAADQSPKDIHAAQVTDWNQSAPVYTIIPHPPPPPPVDTAGDTPKVYQIRVLAAGLHSLTRARAKGQHYTASALPHIPGFDGVGVVTNPPAGKEPFRAYFMSMAPDHGSMAQVINLPSESVIPLPDGADPIQVAALINPAMASWLALTRRAFNLPLTRPGAASVNSKSGSSDNGFSIAILGVTSISGQVAAALARKLGATRVVGVARNIDKMNAIPGLDAKIVLNSEQPDKTDWSPISFPHGAPSSTQQQKPQPVDVILDFICGAPAESLLAALTTAPGSGNKVQYIAVGAVAGVPQLTLQSVLLRSKNLIILGSGPGGWDMREFKQEMTAGGGMLDAVAALRGREVPKMSVQKLSDIETVWKEKEGGDERVVFVP